jgi:hypothetical protein
MKAEDIKSILEKKLCPVHDIYPIVELTGDEIDVVCCCGYFSNFCKIEAEYLKSHSQRWAIQNYATSSHN